MSDPFSVFNTGPISIVRNNATQDVAGGPVANYEVVEADVEAQVEDHPEKQYGNEIDAYGQLVNVHQTDVTIGDGNMRWYLGDTGNGHGIIYFGDRFGRITGVNRQKDLLAIKTTLKLIVKVMGVMPEA